MCREQTVNSFPILFLIFFDNPHDLDLSIHNKVTVWSSHTGTPWPETWPDLYFFWNPWPETVTWVLQVWVTVCFFFLILLLFFKITKFTRGGVTCSRTYNGKYIHIYHRVCVSVCVSVCVFVCVCVCCVCICMDMYIYRLCIYMCICIHIIYMYTHTHTHTHTYIYMYGDMNPYDLVLTSFFPMVSATVDKQSVGIFLLFSLQHIYVGYTETISG